MRVDDEFYAICGKSFAQLMELFLAQHNSKMGNWHVMLVNMVAVLLRHERIVDIAHYQLMREEAISDMMGPSFYFLAANHLRVELMRFLQGIGGDCDA